MLTLICLGTVSPSTWDGSFNRIMYPAILYTASPACSLASTTLTGLGLLVYSE